MLVTLTVSTEDTSLEQEANVAIIANDNNTFFITFIYLIFNLHKDKKKAPKGQLYLDY